MKRQSDEEIRKRHNLSEDVPILDNPPPESELKAKGFLIKIGEVLGVQEWMWKSWGGIVLAVLIVVPAVCGHLSFWKPVAVYSYSQFSQYLATFQPPETTTDNRYIAFVEETLKPADSTKERTMDLLPIGTGVFPVSGSKFV